MDDLSGRTALVAGASGPVGQALLERLLEDGAYARVIAAVRRPLARRHPKLVSVTVDFHRIADFRRELVADDVYCCLGNTLARAGSKEAFRRVDYDYCVELARVARAAGSRSFVLVSAAGASPRSSIFLSRVKGELEDAIRRIGFRRYFVVRPALLEGERVGRALARCFAPFMIGPTAKYRPIPPDAVARAMVTLGKSSWPSGVFESNELARIAERTPA